MYKLVARKLTDKQLLSRFLRIPMHRLHGKKLSDILERYVRLTPENEKATYLYELCHRYMSTPVSPGWHIKSAQTVYEYYHPRLRLEGKEHAFVMCLDQSNSMIHDELLSVGTLDATYLHPRNVFSVALETNAASIILIHNHTTEFSNPSKTDLQVTKRIQKVGREMGIPLLDHVIVSRNCYASCLYSEAFYEYDFPDHL